MRGVELKGLKTLQGLDQLLKENQPPDSEKTPQSLQHLIYVSLDRLCPGQYQPRSQFNEQALTELTETIRQQGILQPLLVRAIDRESYEIIAGERRYRAALAAGLTQVPVIVREISHETALAFALIENIQRAELGILDEALAIQRLQDEFALTHEQIAKRIGRSRSAISNAIRLLDLPLAVKEDLRIGRLDMGHARALLQLAPADQLALADKIVQENLSVREAERWVRRVKAGMVSADAEQKHQMLASHKQRAAFLSETLGKRLARTVKIQIDAKGRGKIILSTQNLTELAWLAEHLHLDV